MMSRDERAQIGRQHGQHVHNHPFELHAAALEGFQHFQAFGDFFDFGVGIGAFQLLPQGFHFGGDVEAGEQVADAFRAHFGVEIVAVFFQLLIVVFFGQQLAALQRGHAGVGYDEGFKIEDAFDVAQSHVQHHAQSGRQGFQKPDVGDGGGQFDVSHAFAAHFGQGYFHAAFLAGNAFEFQAFVFAAQAFVVFYRAEDFGAEEAVALGFEGAVVDGFGFFHFAVRPRADGFGRGDADFDGVEFFFHSCCLQGVKQI